MGPQVLKRRKGQEDGPKDSSELPVQGLSRANEIKFIFQMLALLSCAELNQVAGQLAERG